ncbi:XrtA system polysaccharide deacetylase [Aliikangiella sp. G2MR2-5]|uniref:XrtA system polysaccharide deacetylase n=1 Tax=Aliikangiella sp. G2MR2-5 TaxID=2788943 RepID=UPI0018AA2243|nr:XrtA system polysaccharide deacetylase [Aliikangiella sp. G2MR2-5]
MENHQVNTFTVDVEDYFQVEAMSRAVDREKWDDYECRVEKNTGQILELMEKKGQIGTFFILGWVAKRYPEIVRAIAAQGHEIASHGMTHQLIYRQDIETFRQETLDSKKLLEDIIQKPIKGYRAATYSITEKSLWALDVLIEAGYQYDSSIFPMRHDNYGIPDINPDPHILTAPCGETIVEFPISTVKEKGFTLPIAGGGYFRLFPYAFTRWGLNRINKKNKPFVFYIHPWEVDPEQPKVAGLSKFSKFRHYNNLEKCEQRLERLMSDFRFTTMEQVLVNLGLLEAK